MKSSLSIVLMAAVLVGFFAPVVATAQPAATPAVTLPLKTARTATFTTTKGTWMSLDVSPDGQTIVFDLLGDLYTMPITGGKAARLTSGMAYDAQPRFSPDGRKITFISDRSGGENVWIMSLDKKDTTQLTKGNNNMYVSPEWTPDGQYVVASRSGGLGGTAKLWQYHVDGGNGLPLTTTLFVVCRAQWRLAIQQHRRAVPTVCVGQGIGSRVADVHTLRIRFSSSIVA